MTHFKYLESEGWAMILIQKQSNIFPMTSHLSFSTSEMPNPMILLKYRNTYVGALALKHDSLRRSKQYYQFSQTFTYLKGRFSFDAKKQY